VETVKLLLVAGSDVNVFSSAEDTALRLAAKRNHLDVLQALNDAEHPHRYQHGPGRSALHSRKLGKDEAVSVLVRNRADVIDSLRTSSFAVDYCRSIQQLSVREVDDRCWCET
jgi:hypothetical protein